MSKITASNTTNRGTASSNPNSTETNGRQQRTNHNRSNGTLGVDSLRKIFNDIFRANRSNFGNTSLINDGIRNIINNNVFNIEVNDNDNDAQNRTLDVERLRKIVRNNLVNPKELPIDCAPLNAQENVRAEETNETNENVASPDNTNVGETIIVETVEESDSDEDTVQAEV